MSEPAIEVSELTKRYGSFTAINNLTFSVRKGEILGFLGPNGAGKSTTMRILTGFLPASSGSARVAGFPVATRADEVKRRLGYMPENNPLPEDMRVREYLRFRGALKGLGGARLRERMDDVLERCDLRRVSTRLIGALSKGFRQRVGIAEAILAEPEVVIMDEPTIGLDPHQIIMIRDLIASLRGRLTMLVSSHILPEIEMTCDRVLILSGGHIVATGTPAELRRTLIREQTWMAELSGPRESVAAAVLRAGGTAQVTDAEAEGSPPAFRTVRILSADGDDFGERLLRAFVEEPSLTVRSLARRQATLEEVFLAATRRSWDALTPPPGEKPSARRNEGIPAN